MNKSKDIVSQQAPTTRNTPGAGSNTSLQSQALHPFHPLPVAPVPLPYNPVFLRLSNGGTRRQLWPGIRLNYWNIRYLISPGPWNKGIPPVRAHNLVKQGKTSGVPLIDYQSLIAWLQQAQSMSPVSQAPSPTFVPPYLTVPASGEVCPCTSLRHTVFSELTTLHGPYGNTGIHARWTVLPGHRQQHLIVDTHEVLTFIRSLPPPQYTISGPPKAHPGNTPNPPEPCDCLPALSQLAHGPSASGLTAEESATGPLV